MKWQNKCNFNKARRWLWLRAGGIEIVAIEGTSVADSGQIRS